MKLFEVYFWSVFGLRRKFIFAVDLETVNVVVDAHRTSLEVLDRPIYEADSSIKENLLAQLGLKIGLGESGLF